MNKIFIIIIISTNFCAEFKSQRQYEIEQKLHAPCCWGGVIAEHDSPLANNIKSIIKTIISNDYNWATIYNTIKNTYQNENIKNYSQQHIKKNMTDNEIVNFFIGLHGEKIRALPENNGLGWIAWKLPTFMLILSILIAIFIIKKFRSTMDQSINVKENHNFKKVDEEMKRMGI